jgi:hypothetical protein
MYKFSKVLSFINICQKILEQTHKFHVKQECFECAWGLLLSKGHWFKWVYRPA